VNMTDISIEYIEHEINSFPVRGNPLDWGSRPSHEF
jgi:hypothetical protein